MSQPRIRANRVAERGAHDQQARGGQGRGLFQPPEGAGRDGGRASGGRGRSDDRRGSAEGLGRGRSGGAAGRGLSVRDLKRTAVALDVPEPVAAFWVELAYAAGLLASDGEADERYAATPAYDEWRERPAAERWTRLATAWLAATRTSGLVGGRDAKDRPLSALGPGLDRSVAPEVRHRVLALLAGLSEGAAPVPGSVLARLRWERPLRGARGGVAGVAAGEGGRGPGGSPAERGPGAGHSPAAEGAGGSPAGGPAGDGDGDDLRSRLARWTLDEAEMLGITGRGALSAHGRALLGAPAPRRPDAEPEGPGASCPSTTGPPRRRSRSPPPSRPPPPLPPPACSRRCCPSRWTTCSSRPT
ncbi:hypothetical protein SGRIM128S_08108 [Streptomyces griseomycini]